LARELGFPAVVGTGLATQALADGQIVTLSCAERETGRVYAGSLSFEISEVAADELPPTRTPSPS
jgi:pyruvate,water dikinase